MALDIIFLSYDEPLADKHFDQLVDQYPYAKRVHGIAGIREAHYAAADTARTSSFFVVDGDTEIHANVDSVFSFEPDEWHTQYLHLWYSMNPVNGLVYGYGGIKLFHKSMFASRTTTPYTDFAATASAGMKIMSDPGEYVSTTHFNSSAFIAWRSGFRESAKLARAWIDRGDLDSNTRLQTWTSVANTDAQFSDEVLQGAQAGNAYAHQDVNISNINNIEWLKEQYAISRR